VRKREIRIVLFFLLALVFVSAALFFGITLSAHTHSCHSCTQPDGRSMCPVFIKLQEISRHLTGISPGFNAWYVADLIVLQVSIGYILKKYRYTSLVAWNVKFSC